MKQEPDSTNPWGDAQNVLPATPDCETLTLLRGFLGPILDSAQDWTDLRARLVKKGFDPMFRLGHLVIVNRDTGQAVCTGSMLGTPLREIASRIGRPVIRVRPDGLSGDLI